MEATRSIALASSTDVPPNFMTIIGGASLDQFQELGRLPLRCARDPSLRPKTGWAQDDARGVDARLASLRFRSSQVSLRFQEFRIQHGGPRCAPDRVVRKHSEFPVEHAAGT